MRNAASSNGSEPGSQKPAAESDDSLEPAFQTLLLSLSAVFAGVSAREIDALVNQWLGKVARLTNIERATLWQFSADGQTLHRRRFYSQSGSSAPSPDLPGTHFPWLTAQSLRGRVIAWARIPDEVPAAATEERAYVTALGAKALLSIPVMSGSSMYVLAMTSRVPRREWLPSLIFSLRLVAGIFANALERARAETSLQAMQERHRAVLRALPDMLFVISAEGNYLEYYGKDDRDLLVEPAAFLGRSINEVLPADVAHALKSVLERVSRHDEIVTHEFSLTVAGRMQHYEARLVRRDDGAIVGIVRNMTETVQRRTETERLRLELTHAGRAALLGQLTASLAHDLQQPITAVVANTEAAQLQLKHENLDRRELQLLLSDVTESALLASEQIRRVQSYLRKERLSHRPVDLNQLANEVSRVVQSQLRMRGVLLVLELADSLPATVGDSIELQQVILNLLLNGAEAMTETPPSQRVLTLRTSVALERVRLSVYDRGPGVAHTDLQRIFEPFFSTKSHGIGMGLSISSKIIRDHGGELCAERLEEGGMHFYFSLNSAAKSASRSGSE